MQHLGLIELLSAIQPRVSPQAAPSYEELLRLMSLTASPHVAANAASYLGKFHPGWMDLGKWRLRICLQWLKHAASKNDAGADPAKRLLEEYRKRSFFNRLFAWSRKPLAPAPGYREEWWKLGRLAAVAVPNALAQPKTSQPPKSASKPAAAAATSGAAGQPGHQFDSRGICTRCGCSLTAVQSFGFACTVAGAGSAGSVRIE
jgi:hypothetical protein